MGGYVRFKGGTVAVVIFYLILILLYICFTMTPSLIK